MIGENKLRRIINFVLIVSIIFFTSCINDKKKIIKRNNKVEILKIDSKKILNQVIFYNEEGSVDYSKSHFYEIDNERCINYYSIFDTLKNKIGVDRFIVFKTSNSLKSDFSNIKDVKLEEYFFKNRNYLCLNRETIPNYGIIEDIVFLKTDSIIDDEKSKRIRTIYQYINFKNQPNWLELKE